jgi:hypothetical protein
MTWTPSIGAVTPRAIPDNLLTYCTNETRQRDALTWAGGATTLPLIRSIASIRANPTLPPYPSIAYTDDNDEQDFDDEITAVYQCTFLIGVQATTAALATSNARVYDKAFTSMMVNCPASTLGANTGAASTAKIQGKVSGFLVVKAGNEGKATNDFLQEFQIRLTISMFGAAHI